MQTGFWIVGIEGENCNQVCNGVNNICKDPKFQAEAKKINQEDRVVLHNPYEIMMNQDLKMNANGIYYDSNSDPILEFNHDYNNRFYPALVNGGMQMAAHANFGDDANPTCDASEPYQTYYYHRICYCVNQ